MNYWVDICRRKRAGAGRSGFTLIELLMVIGLIAAVYLIAAPGVRTALRGGSEQSGTVLQGTIRLARQHAITHRVRTYVVFAPRATTSATLPYNLRAYAVMAQTNSINTATTQADYISEWRVLPKGCYFDLNATNSIMTKGTASFSFPDETASITLSMPFIMFKPNGKAYVAASVAPTDVNIPVTTGISYNPGDGASDLGTPTARAGIRYYYRVRGYTGQFETIKQETVN